MIIFFNRTVLVIDTPLMIRTAGIVACLKERL